MIVDDDSTTVSLLQTLLELDGYDVQVVMRGNDVIPKAEQNTPDLILMDYNLNDTNGIEVLKQLRQHERLAHLPIIIASGMNVEQEVEAAGGNAFITKPFEPTDLSKMFERFLN